MALQVKKLDLLGDIFRANANQAQQNQARRPNPPKAAVPQRPGVRFQNDFFGGLGDAIGSYVDKQVVKPLTSNPGKALTDFGTDTFHALASTPERMYRSLVLEPLVGNATRPASKAISTASNPNTDIREFFYGKAPVQSYQEIARNAQLAGKSSDNASLQKLAPYAPFIAPVMGALDATVIKGGLGLTKVGVDSAIPASKQVIQSVKSTNVKGPRPAIQAAAVETPKVAKPVGAPMKGPNVVSRVALPTSHFISEHGTGGKAIASSLKNARNYSEVAQEAFVEKIPTVMKLHKNDFTKFVDALDTLSQGKRVKNISPTVSQAVKEWSKAAPALRQEAVKSGLKVGDLGKYYFPREYKDLINGKNLSNYAQQLVNSGKAKNMNEAMQILQFAKTEYTRPYGHLEKSRIVDLPGYEKTHDALLNYIQRSYDRIGKSQEFGPTNEKLQSLQAQVLREGYDATPGSNFDKQLKIALGDVDHNTTAHRVSSGIRKVNAVRSLSAAAVANANQLVNTATVAGVGRTAKGLFKLATDKTARTQAKQTGVLLDHTINDLAKQGLGTGGKISKNIASPFFNLVEKFNRQTTAIVGQDWGNALARKAFNGNAKAERILRDKLGVTGPIGKQLTRNQEVQASRGLVEVAQFKVDPMDLPGWVDSPMGKVVSQFRTFGYKQTGFVWAQVVKEASQGNFLPLTRYVTLATPMGMASSAVKRAIKLSPQQDNQDGNWWDEPLNGFMSAGGLGMASSEPNNIANGIKYNNLPGAVAGTLGGPTASIVVETAANTQKAINGNPRPLEKTALRNIPTVGPTLSNLLLPSDYATPGKVDPSTLNPEELKKFRGAAFNKFRNSLASEDKRIFDLQQNTDAAKLALKNGKVTQDQLDGMQAKYNQAKLDYGLPIDYIDNISYDEFNKFDTSTQNLITQASLVGKRKFGEKKSVDDASRAVIDTAKQNAWPNTGDIKATNKLALDYVKTLKDMQAAGEDQGKQYELYKGFWKKAVKAQYNNTVEDAYASSVTDIKRLSTGININGKRYQIDKPEMDQLIDLDNRLLIAGLIDTPKFSNKVRAAAGYGKAPASKTPGVGLAESTSGGGKAKTKYLNPYKYAVSPRAAGSRPKVAIRRIGDTRLQVASAKPVKPKVSIKKSLV